MYEKNKQNGLGKLTKRGKVGSHSEEKRWPEVEDTVVPQDYKSQSFGVKKPQTT